MGSETRRSSPRAVLFAVGFAVFVAADDLTVVATMLRPIIGDLGLVLPDGLDDAAWIVNAYLIAFVAVMPLAGRLSDVIGRRTMFLIAYSVFVVGTIVIPLSDTLGPFLVGRVLTALGGGAMVPVALAVVGDVYPRETRARALGTLGAIETFGWVWGPLYGAMLVRFLSWEWQFWLNVPLAAFGLVIVWRALEGHDVRETRPRVDWIGAALVTVFLVALNLALLGGAEIQSVTGLDELTGHSDTDLRWLYIVAALAAVGFVVRERRARDPLVNPALFAGRNLRLALLTNFIVGAAIVITMVDVPLFVNAVEIDLERSAVIAGWVLAVMTASMALTSYAGGRLTERTWYGPPIAIGLAAATGAFVAMGFTWDGDISYTLMAIQLAMLGAGLGLTVAPTNTAVITAADDDERGAAAALVMVTRLLGFSVGLSALTAWGLSRFNELRDEIDLPPLTDPGFEDALRDAQESLTAQAIAETFLATAALTAVGVIAAAAMRRRDTKETETPMTDMPPDSTDEGQDHAAADASPEPEAAVAVAVAVARPSWLHRHLGLVLGVFALALIGAFLWIAKLSSDLDKAEDDLARVEAGSALFASQVQGFQNQLTELAPTVSAGIDEAVAGLESFATSTLEFDVAIDDTIAIDTEVVIDRVVEVPIKTTLPIDQTFDTTIQIAGPFGIDIPLDVTVPVDVDVPIDLTVSIPINETIPFDTEIPVKVDVPISVDVSETELAELTNAIAAGLKSFQEILSGLGS